MSSTKKAVATHAAVLFEPESKFVTTPHRTLKTTEEITALAQRLKRDRSSVKKDIDQLMAAGLLDVKEVPLPGHGRQKFVRAVADSIQLQAIVA